MPIEIERKFLLASDAWRESVHAVIDMAQGYLNDAASVAQGAQNASVRVRIEAEQAHLNIKSRELGARRQEFDYPIPLQDARALIGLCVGGIVEKRRHLLRHGAHLWEIDEFRGENAGLVVAEIELADENEDFMRPAWLGREVTHLARYYNLAIAARPYSQWTRDERAMHATQGDAPCL